MSHHTHPCADTPGAYTIHTGSADIHGITLRTDRAGIIAHARRTARGLAITTPASVTYRHADGIERLPNAIPSASHERQVTP